MSKDLEQDAIFIDLRSADNIEDMTVQDVDQEEVELEITIDDMTEDQREMIISIAN